MPFSRLMLMLNVKQLLRAIPIQSLSGVPLAYPNTNPVAAGRLQETNKDLTLRSCS